METAAVNKATGVNGNLIAVLTNLEVPSIKPFPVFASSLSLKITSNGFCAFIAVFIVLAITFPALDPTCFIPSTTGDNAFTANPIPLVKIVGPANGIFITLLITLDTPSTKSFPVSDVLLDVNAPMTSPSQALVNMSPTV